MRKYGYKIQLAILIILSNLFRPLYSQNDDIKFEPITTEQGLSSNTVYDIIQDSQGFMWFATDGGLCRYDGYKIKQYKYNPLDTNSIGASYAARIFEDRSGNLWIGTVNGGLNRFDTKTEKFTRYKHDPDDPHTISDNTVFGICEDSSGNFWVGTWSGLDRLTVKKDSISKKEIVEFIHFKNDTTDSNNLSDFRIWRTYLDRSNILWIGTQAGGLNKFDINTGRFTHYQHIPSNPLSISHNRVGNIYEDPLDNGNTLWLATLGGLNKFDKQTETFTHFKYNPDDPFSLNDDNVKQIYRDTEGTLWIATRKGLDKLISSRAIDEQNVNHPPDLKFIHYQHDPSNFYSLTKDYVLCMYQDRSGVMWLGTWQGGVNKFTIEKKKFITHLSDPNQIVFKDIRSICEDENGWLWFGTGSGIYRFNEKDKSITRYANNPDDLNSLSDDNIYSVCEDRYYPVKTIWIGCYGSGLDRLQIIIDEKTEVESVQITHFKHNPEDSLSVSSDCIDKIYLDNSGRLWIGTCEGLNLFDRSTETFTRYFHDPIDSSSLSHNWVRVIYQAPGDENILWIGTENGMNKFYIKEKLFKRFKYDPTNIKSISDNYIQCFCADSKNKGKILWIGTYSGGLNRFDVESEECTSFTEEDGLVDNSIRGILEDDNGNLWISTKNGISKFDPQSQKFTNYRSDDGIIEGYFYRNSYFKTKSREIFFGGINGLVVFNPNKIEHNNHIPPILITDFRIYDKPARFQQSIIMTKEINLSHKQNFFSFEFTALDYMDPAKNQYAYMLEGVDKNWIYSGDRRYVSYANVSSGKYIFKVKGSNNDGIWNEEGTSVKIIITPPFWQTWWFYSLVGIFIIGLLAWIYYIRVSRLIKQRNAQQAFSKQLIEASEKERKRIANELHDSLGQNLLITKNEVIECLNSESLSEVCSRNLKDISELVSESIKEVREIAYNLHPHQLDRLGLTKAIESIVNKVSNSSAPAFALELENVDGLFPKDQEIHIYRIVQEGLNNVIKHANAKNVLIEISRSDDVLKILINDDGKGFNLKRNESTPFASSGLGLVGIAERVKILNGDWNIETAQKKGTILNITIPVKG